MHHIHTTLGLIIDARPYGEAGKIFSIFTREFGLVRASAQGIRLEKSKLRYHARELALGRFSLVRGKEIWRLTSALETEETLPQHRALIARLSLVLRRLLHGEEARAEAFDAAATCIAYLRANPDLSEQRSEILEALTVARMLHWLGYIGDDNDLRDHIAILDISDPILDEVSAKKSAFNRHINKAFQESQM